MGGSQDLNWDTASDEVNLTINDLASPGPGISTARVLPDDPYRGHALRVELVTGVDTSFLWGITAEHSGEISTERFVRWQFAIKLEEEIVFSADRDGLILVRARDSSNVSLGHMFKTQLTSSGLEPASGFTDDRGVIPINSFVGQWMLFDMCFDSLGSVADAYEVHGVLNAYVELGSKMRPIGFVEWGAAGRESVLSAEELDIGFLLQSQAPGNSFKFLIDEMHAHWSDAQFPNMLPKGRRTAWPTTIVS